MFFVYLAPTKPLSSYVSRFKGAVNVVKLLGRSPWSHPAATKIVYNKLYSSSNYMMDKHNNSNDYQAAATEAQRRYLAALFFHGLTSATTLTETSRKKIHNDALTGSDTVPRTNNKVLQLAASTNPCLSNVNTASKKEAALLSRKRARPLRRQKKTAT